MLNTDQGNFLIIPLKSIGRTPPLANAPLQCLHPLVFGVNNGRKKLSKQQKKAAFSCDFLVRDTNRNKDFAARVECRGICKANEIAQTSK